MNLNKAGRIQRSSFISVFISITMLFVLSGCAEEASFPANSQTSTKPTTFMSGTSSFSPATPENYKLVTAKRDPINGSLLLAGTANNSGERLIIRDANTGVKLASTLANSSLDWSINIKTSDALPVIPCNIGISSQSVTFIANVTNDNCEPSTLVSRATVSASGIIFPTAIINSPSTYLDPKCAL